MTTDQSAVTCVTDLFVLPTDAEMIAVSDLPEAQRHSLGDAFEGYVLTRPQSRASSRLIEPMMAMLLKEFADPSSIVDAVIRFAGHHGVDAEAALEEAYPALVKLIETRFLVAENGDSTQSADRELSAGEVVGDYVVEKRFSMPEDTSIYRARSTTGIRVAVKMARRSEDRGVADFLRREASILEVIAGGGSPSLLARGKRDGREYVVMEWCDGVVVSRAAARLRADHTTFGRCELKRLVVRIARAYAALHARGVLHGDVHPGNLVVADDGEVRILDMGLARVAESDDGRLRAAPRGAVAFYYEPEYARAYLESGRAPQITALGEQHLLAHVLYVLITGREYTRFSADKEQFMSELVSAVPLPFAEHGVDPWPGVEEALGRALDVEPTRRYESVDALAEALAVVAVPEPIPLPLPPRRADVALTDELTENFVALLDPAADLFATGVPEPPFATVNLGSAGIAYYLYRLAQLDGEPRYVQWARLWIERGIEELHRDAYGLEDRDGEFPTSRIGPVSLYNAATGVFVVKTLIAHASGDVAGQVSGVTQFLTGAGVDWDVADVTLGRSGLVIGAMLIREALGGDNELTPSLDDFIAAHFRRLREYVSAAAALDDPRQPLGYTGIAHGWAGLLYTLLLRIKADGLGDDEMLSQIDRRLRQLADLRETTSTGVRWSRIIRSARNYDEHDFDLSWCNGTAGMVFLWTLAHDVFGEPRWLELAEASAANVIAGRSMVNQLCCGRPGQAYGVLNLFRHTGDERWLGYGRELAAQSLAMPITPPGGKGHRFSLYKGALGTSLLSAELAEPERMAMPLFELQGWR